MNKKSRIAEMLVVVSIGSTLGASACQVPVFRYALERWKADPHVLVVAYDGELSGGEKALVQQLEEDGWKCNIEVNTVDFSKEEEAEQFPEIAPGGPYPRLVAYYPHGTFQKEPYWQGAFNAENVGKLLDSPMRQQLLKNITDGNSAVWLLIESGDAAKDDAAEARLKEMLAAAGDGLEIPDGVITADEAERVLAEQGSVDMKDILQSAIPLMINFSVLRISQEDVAGPESILFRMLLGMEPETLKSLEEKPEVIIAPVFGRGRMLPGIPLSEVGEDAIWAACQYLCGECSCEVKSENPGFDLLLKAEWDEIMDGNFVIVERTLPPLTGTGDLIAEAASLTGTGTGTEAPEEEEKGAKVGPAPDELAAARLKRNIALFGGVFAIALVGVTLIIRKNGGN